MFRANVQITEIVSLGVMLMMIVALIAGQSGASADELTSKAKETPVIAVGDHLTFDLDARLGDNALDISLAVVAEISHFRGEDE